MNIEHVAETIHADFVGGFQFDIGDGVESNQIDFTRDAFEEANQLTCMARSVVQASENDVFEGEMALVCEVMLA